MHSVRRYLAVFLLFSLPAYVMQNSDEQIIDFSSVSNNITVKNEENGFLITNNNKDSRGFFLKTKPVKLKKDNKISFRLSLDPHHPKISCQTKLMVGDKIIKSNKVDISPNNFRVEMKFSVESDEEIPLFINFSGITSSFAGWKLTELKFDHQE